MFGIVKLDLVPMLNVGTNLGFYFPYKVY